jgi:cytochrome c5
MSDYEGISPSTVFKSILSLLGAQIVPAVIVFMIAGVVMGIRAGHSEGESAATIAERIKPVGEVTLKGVGGPQVMKSGEQVVNETCNACHGTGALGAPKIGDKGAWGPRIGQGFDTLIKNATNGIRAMPARGGNADLADEEVAGAIAYMANKSGASFKAPEPKAEAAPAADAAKAKAPAPAK